MPRRCTRVKQTESKMWLMKVKKAAWMIGSKAVDGLIATHAAKTKKLAEKNANLVVEKRGPNETIPRVVLPRPNAAIKAEDRLGGKSPQRTRLLN